MGDTPRRAAIWARVSTSDQDTANQLQALHAYAQQRGLEITEWAWSLEESAWNGKHRKALDKALAAATLHKFDVLLVWALDRLSREGGEEMLKVVRQFRERGVQVLSLQDPWTEMTSDPIIAELMTGIMGTLARAESVRRSERVRAGIAARKAAGTWTGRGKDKHTAEKPRRKTGNYSAAAKEREAAKRKERAEQAKAQKVLAQEAV